ncbi:MAG: AzlD domain-containing protein [Pseudomonadota bacterium]
MIDTTSFMTAPVGLLAILAIALLVHEPWRWLGLYIGNTLPAGSVAFDIVRAMATALVAGLVMRLVLFPAGALADVELAVRVDAFGIGIVLFFIFRHQLGVGVFGAGAALILGQLFMR